MSLPNCGTFDSPEAVAHARAWSSVMISLMLLNTVLFVLPLVGYGDGWRGFSQICPAGCSFVTKSAPELQEQDLSCDHEVPLWAVTKVRLIQFVRDGYFADSWEVEDAAVAGGNCVLGMICLRLLLAYCASSVEHGDWCNWRGIMIGNSQTLHADLTSGAYDADWRILTQYSWQALMRSGWPVFGLLAMLSSLQNPSIAKIGSGAEPILVTGRAPSVDNLLKSMVDVEKVIACLRCVRQSVILTDISQSVGQLQDQLIRAMPLHGARSRMVDALLLQVPAFHLLDLLSREVQKPRFEISNMFYFTHCRQEMNYDAWSISFRFLSEQEANTDDSTQFLDSLGGSRWEVLPSPSLHHIVADPMCIAWSTNTHTRFLVFMEEVDNAEGYSLGHISVIEVFRDGTFTWPPQGVIHEAHHLSYPFVFQWPPASGQFFMLLANMPSRCVDLYWAESFPFKWRLHGPIIRGLLPRDPTLLVWGGVFWIFVSDNKDSDLSIFFATNIVGPYQRHPASRYHTPIRDPLRGEVATMRPAGAFIVTPSGRVLRPSQESTKKNYGMSILLNEVVDLSSETYQEAQVKRLLPLSPWFGAHTIGVCGALLVSDLKEQRATFKAMKA